ncbi:hypothetical protein COCMIDRAFT_79566 [Bipolaris oryzae ATCC 44560]|uniref:Uncharacterized protein n=1 Tax=Bipolaris oryzae ATCC 44560 TaxID=930090 RepID=W6ZMQ1_COCMI|nr:uncharacterized protein COCMIDRAFT_79566 [Bipolaris oryzae ATCC 44560]EUC51258.1 hypothetical protein COCMIDRAFT_79566 [Bipolaris oryzae ATCC 44560]
MSSLKHRRRLNTNAVIAVHYQPTAVLVFSRFTAPHAWRISCQAFYLRSFHFHSHTTMATLLRW